VGVRSHFTLRGNTFFFSMGVFNVIGKEKLEINGGNKNNIYGGSRNRKLTRTIGEKGNKIRKKSSGKGGL